MTRRLSVLCPIDFSVASAGALRFAAAVAEHGGGQLTVMTVDDPILASMDATRGTMWQSERSRGELDRTVSDLLGLRAAALDVQFAVAVGRPADEILRVARERHADLIVMSSHGLTGVRKLFFGSTTERVLRAAEVPVLVSRAADAGPSGPDEVKTLVNRVLVPVDLDQSADRQVASASTVAEVLGVPILVAHVVEPTRLPFPRRADGTMLDAERRAKADDVLEQLATAALHGVPVETLVAYGDPAEEIAKIARDRHVGLIVMPLRGNETGAPGVGSVAYRVLCLAPATVLALPRAAAEVRAVLPKAADVAQGVSPAHSARQA